jgi:hypothetical protein
MKMAVFIVILFLGNAAAQDYIDPEWISVEKKSTRSIHVNPSDIEGQPYWCSYAIDRIMKNFMDDHQRNEFRKHAWLTIGDRTSSCVWMNSCQKGWDKMESVLEKVLKGSKTIQYENYKKRSEEIQKYNEQSKKEEKPLKQIPRNLPQLTGDADVEYDFVHIQIEELNRHLKFDCMRNQLSQNLELHIDTDLDSPNKNQDQAYLSSRQYAEGVYRNIHYRLVEMQQNHVLISNSESIYPGDYVYSLSKDMIVVEP